ncbi:14471_t:CDS:2 [Ambispora leptoticha]|uniref:14471_t:CDS:1 n=1 Tax=Ambispora leptoticha TaxID=144679 RepID=A0A9N8VML5_9GLOM|nr:14471_t:CDS:2 [Ambispora leptoticha]
MPEISHPTETVGFLLKYETDSGQAQKFLADDGALKYDDEAGFNLISFFDNLDKSTFNEYKDSWMKKRREDLAKHQQGQIRGYATGYGEPSRVLLHQCHLKWQLEIMLLGQFFFVHQPDQGYKFLRATDEDS